MWLALVALACCEEVIYSCKRSGGQPVVNTSYVEDADAWVKFADDYGVDGWGKVHVWTNGSSSSEDQMYCAGYVDAYATQERMAQGWKLFREGWLLDESTGKLADWPVEWSTWMRENLAYMEEQCKSTDPYWQRMKLVLTQVKAMLDGYNARAAKDEQLTSVEWWLWQGAGDLDDISEVYPIEKLKKDPEFKLHCTGMVQLSPDYQNLFMGHSTWSDARDLHAYMKEYNLNVEEFKAKRVLISTRTGHLASVDDFWVSDMGLYVYETTMHCFNETLYKTVTPKSLMTRFRSYHAMFATDNGKDWTAEFIKENSGTYNNEYMVVDAKKFTPGKKPTSDLLWVIEQFPSLYRSQDITGELAEQLFQQGINTPRWADMRTMAGYDEQQAKDPKKADFWSWDKQMRNILIMKYAPDVSTYDDFQKLMRYNDYIHDPLQIIPGTEQHEPAQGIIARYDLRPENGTNYGARNHFGGIDTKTVSIVDFQKTQKFDSINSMKWDDDLGIPPFSFADWPMLSHDGLPEVFTFNWTTFGSNDQCTMFNGDEDKCINIYGCGYCKTNNTCWSGNQTMPSEYFCYTCAGNWVFKVHHAAWEVPVIASVSSIVLVVVIAIFVLHFVTANKKDNDYDEIKY